MSDSDGSASPAGLGPFAFLVLGCPATGERTVGTALARRVDGVLVDDASIDRPVLEVLRWDGVAPLPPGTPTAWRPSEPPCCARSRSRRRRRPAPCSRT